MITTSLVIILLILTFIFILITIGSINHGMLGGAWSRVLTTTAELSTLGLGGFALVIKKVISAAFARGNATSSDRSSSNAGQSNRSSSNSKKNSKATGNTYSLGFFPLAITALNDWFQGASDLSLAVMGVSLVSLYCVSSVAGYVISVHVIKATNLEKEKNFPKLARVVAYYRATSTVYVVTQLVILLMSLLLLLAAGIVLAIKS